MPFDINMTIKDLRDRHIYFLKKAQEKEKQHLFAAILFSQEHFQAKSKEQEFLSRTSLYYVVENRLHRVMPFGNRTSCFSHTATIHTVVAEERSFHLKDKEYFERNKNVLSHTDAISNQLVILDACIDELKLSTEEKEHLLMCIINSTDRAIEDAFLDGVKYTLKIAKKLCPKKEVAV